MEAIAAPLTQAWSALESGDPSCAIRHLNVLLREGASTGQLVEAADFVRSVDPRLSRRLAMRALEQAGPHAMATHLLAEATARLGLSGRAHEMFRDAVKRDGRLANLAALRRGELADEEQSQPWIGRFEDVACPGCGEVAGKPVWAGNISAQHSCHGVIDPIRLWVRCIECGLVRDASPAPPPVIEAWHRLESGKRRRPPSPSSLASAVRTHDRVIERIRDEGYGVRWVERGSRAPRLLDANASWGTFLAAAEWRGFEVQGLARDRKAARWATDKLGVNIEPAELPDDLPDGPFDVVTLWGLLDRLPDAVTVLSELAERIEEGGLLALSTPSRDHPAHLAQGYDDALWCHPERRVWYDRESLAVVLLRAGLQPVRSWHDHREIGSIVVLSKKLGD